jgi:hypothetical protein
VSIAIFLSHSYCSNRVNGQSRELNYWHREMLSVVEIPFQGGTCCAGTRMLELPKLLVGTIIPELSRLSA